MDTEIDTAIAALNAVKLYRKTYATSPKAVEGVRSVIEALEATAGDHPIIQGVAGGLRRHLGEK